MSLALFINKHSANIFNIKCICVKAAVKAAVILNIGNGTISLRTIEMYIYSF